MAKYKTKIIPMIVPEAICPLCKAPMVFRISVRRNSFVSCSRYPECRFMRGMRSSEFQIFNYYLNTRKKRP